MALTSFLDWKQVQEARLPSAPFKRSFTQPVTSVQHAIERAKEREHLFKMILDKANKFGAANEGTVYTDIKTEKSIQDKMNRPGKAKKLNEIGDFLRGAIVVPSNEDAERVAAFLAKAATKDYKVVAFEFKKDPKSGDVTGYSGSYHIDIEIDGMVCEIQVMTTTLWNIKDVVHKYGYQGTRSGKGIDPQMAQDFRRTFKRLQMPKGEFEKPKVKKFRYDPAND